MQTKHGGLFLFLTRGRVFLAVNFQSPLTCLCVHDASAVVSPTYIERRGFFLVFLFFLPLQFSHPCCFLAGLKETNIDIKLPNFFTA